MSFPTSRFAACAVAVFGSAGLVAVAQTHSAAAPRPPKLAVIIVVDQMRADYVDRFRGDWTAGLKRLVTSGAWFRRTAYPYLTTVTCSGHATASTGAFPHTTGIIQNAWYDRDNREPVSCTQDSNAHDIGYGNPIKTGDSGVWLMTPTFADVMRERRGAHVVTVSLKDRSAIMLAGHGGDAVTWMSNTFDGWVTSSAFANGPNPAVKAFVDANPIDADYGKTWDRLLPADRYKTPDDGEGEAPPNGWTPTFPHVLKGNGTKPDNDFHVQWERSPYADAYLGRFAAALAESLKLGEHDGTDVLGVSFSSTDLVGHAFGPRSQEVQDMYAHLDRTIGTLFDRLDALVGKGNYVVGLTADHGVTPIPEQLKREGKDAGRLNPITIGAIVDTRARALAGDGKYVNRVNGNDVYFEPGMYQKLEQAPGAMKAVLDALGASQGIERVFRSEELKDAANSPDAILRAAALSYFAGRSGDLVIAAKPGWMFSASGTTHGSANPDDQRVPLLFMGRGVKPGQYLEPSTPADLAPTLAALCGIAMPNAEGHVLREALTSAPAMTGGQ